jgi:hypothetical protein
LFKDGRQAPLEIPGFCQHETIKNAQKSGAIPANLPCSLVGELSIGLFAVEKNGEAIVLSFGKSKQKHSMSWPRCGIHGNGLCRGQPALPQGSFPEKADAAG